MEVLKVKELGLEAIQKKLDKAAFDEVELNPRIREKNKELYGEDLTANQIVERIVNEVRHNGDEAVIKYTKLLDGADFTPSQFLVTQEEYAQAYEVADEDIVNSLRKAIENVRRYHQEQKPNSWITYRNHGSILGQSVIPLDRVGVYVPGGTAAYPSSVVMNVMPAKVAGVKEIIMMAPPSRDGKLNPYVLIAAKEAGVDAIYKVGGAQAIAAMAFGTETIPKVDKITGPGNIFVTLAKKAVYGHCDIDMLAGPSEILIVADKTADPVYTAADMLSQAEHDMLASSIVLTDDEALADKVLAEVEKQLAKLPRKEIAKASLERNGRIILTENLMQAMELANYSAPELILWKRHGIAGCSHSGRDNGNGVNRLHIRQHMEQDCMACLMISGDPFLLLGDHLALFLCTDANLDKGILNIFLANKYMTFSGCSNSRLIHQVLKICTCKASCSLSDLFQVYILAKRFILGMNMEDFFSSFNIRTSYANLAVKTSRTKNCRIQNIHTVGSCHYDNAFIYPEAIHLYKKLVQSLFPFIMAASHAGSTLSCNSIDLINEDDTRCVTLALFEKISYT